MQECVIFDCGELAPGEDDGINMDPDGVGDIYPNDPENSELDFKNVSLPAALLIRLSSVVWFLLLLFAVSIIVKTIYACNFAYFRKRQ